MISKPVSSKPLVYPICLSPCLFFRTVLLMSECYVADGGSLTGVTKRVLTIEKYLDNILKVTIPFLHKACLFSCRR